MVNLISVQKCPLLWLIPMEKLYCVVCFVPNCCFCPYLQIYPFWDFEPVWFEKGLFSTVIYTALLSINLSQSGTSRCVDMISLEVIHLEGIILEEYIYSEVHPLQEYNGFWHWWVLCCHFSEDRKLKCWLFNHNVFQLRNVSHKLTILSLLPASVFWLQRWSWVP